jgi:predicted PurR-regulated permease PerM
MPDQVTNKSAVSQQSQERAAEMAPLASISTSDELLRRIAALLFILVAGSLTIFGYYASSICITVILAAFLAILFDPVVVLLEKLHLPRSVAAAAIVLAGMGLIGLLGHEFYGRGMSFAEELPVYTSKIQQTLEPITQKFQKVQQTAGSLTNDVHPSKKVPEVRLQDTQTWPSYLVRGVGSVWGALIIAGVVPFLTFFMLCTKDQMGTRMNALFNSKVDTARFITSLKPDDSRLRSRQPHRRLLDGSDDHTDVVGYWYERRHTHRNRQRSLEPAAIPRTDLFACASSCSAILQFNTPGPYIVITLTIVFLHVVSANFLFPKFIATRMSIGPVAATIGILFWGWLWGVMGLLLAVPLTAFVKPVADIHPSLCHLSNALALTPRPIPRWVRYGETVLERAIPYLRGRPGMNPKGAYSQLNDYIHLDTSLNLNFSTSLNFRRRLKLSTLPISKVRAASKTG